MSASRRSFLALPAVLLAAEAVAPESDPRDVVEQIIDMNRGGPAVTPAGQLRAGEELRLPVGS